MVTMGGGLIRNPLIMGPLKPGGRGLGASARREGTLEAEVPLALGLALHTLCGFASA